VLKRDCGPRYGRADVSRSMRQTIDLNLTDLHAGSIGKRTATPSRRTYIPKADRLRRPLAVAALEKDRPESDRLAG